MQRLGLWCMTLLLLATPALARRRAVTPGAPTHCVTGTLAEASYAQLLAADGQYVYFVDESGAVVRVPKNGGERQLLTDSLGNWLPLSMAVDDTSVYIGALPFEALFTFAPGSILAVPKNGGDSSVLVAGVLTPFELRTDATHVYWVAAGTLDFKAGTAKADGKIERALKDGTSRQTLAADLSVPVGIALDESSVFFGETGAADNDPSVGLYRVAKTGGPLTTLDSTFAVLTVAVDDDTLVFVGGNETMGGVLSMPKAGGPVALLSLEESLAFGLQIVGRRVYFLRQDDETGELAWVDIDTRATSVTRGELDSGAFLIDGCAAVVNTVDGDLIRILR